MKFNIYGRYDLEVTREGDRWVVYRLEDGKRRPEEGLIVPADIEVEAVQIYLDEMLHELARPGTAIEQIE